MRQNGISDMLQVNVNNGNSSTLINLTNGNSSPQPSTAPPVPPRSVNNNGDLIKLVFLYNFYIFLIVLSLILMIIQ